MVTEDRWVTFSLAWPAERAARMDLSLVRVRRWLEADGCEGLGSDGAYRNEARHRALDYGLTSAESLMVHGVLTAEERMLRAPGARVQERAKQVVLAMEAARNLAEGVSGSGPRILGFGGVAGRTGVSTGLLEVERYAVEDHDWDAAGDAGSVVEDMPWRIEDRVLGLRAVPVSWWGIVLDPRLFGLSGNDWRQCAWQFETGKPALFRDAGKSPVAAVLRPFGWSGAPIRADLDDVERYLPTRKGRHMAWLMSGVKGVGWAIAWRVER
jgi:hypothetical protein